MKKNKGRASVWFVHRENPVPGEHFAKPHVLLPVLDTTRVKAGVLTRISNTPRMRIPRHMRYILDISEANTRFIPHPTESSEPGKRLSVALDLDAVHMLRKAGAVLLKQSYRHELMSSSKAG